MSDNVIGNEVGSRSRDFERKGNRDIIVSIKGNHGDAGERVVDFMSIEKKPTGNWRERERDH